MGSIKMCLGFIHHFSKQDGLTRNAEKGKKEASNTFVVPGISNLCLFNILSDFTEMVRI
jgi:hypothetical protein